MATNNPKKEKKSRQVYDRQFLVAKIAMMRIKGKSTHTILEFLQENIGMSRKIAYEILQDAQNYIMEITDRDTERAFANAIQRLEEIFELGTIKEKLDAQKEINKLMGLYATQKIEVSGAVKIETIKLVEIKKDITENG